MHTRIQKCLFVFLALMLVSPSHLRAGDEGKIYTAKKIITFTPGRPVARWVAVKKGTIVALGRNNKSLKVFQRRHNFTHDRRFDTRVIVPGFIDPHLHPLMAGILLPMVFITPEDWTLPRGMRKGVRTPEDYRARLRKSLETARKDEILFTWGYHQLWHGEMSRAVIDEIAPARPVIVWHRSFHEIFLNTAALKHLNLNTRAQFDAALAAAKANPDHADFETGHFSETALAAALPHLRPYILSPAHLTKGLRALEKMLRMNGVTTIADMATGLFADLDTETQLIASVFEKESAAARVLLVPAAQFLTARYGSAEKASAAMRKKRATWPYKNIMLSDRVKLFADGAFFSQYMQMNPPGYTDGHEGKWLTEPDELKKEAAAYWRLGHAIHVHVNGDKAMDVVLDTLEGLRKIPKTRRQQFVLEHVGYTTEAQVRRAKSLRAYASAQPNYVYVLSDKYGTHGLGPERASHMVRLGAFERAGVLLALHSDLTMAPSDPLFLAWIAANRITMEGTRMAPMERISVETALKAVTLNAARVIGMHKSVGRIKPGMRADFTILTEDPTTAPPERLRDIKVEGVVFGGEPRGN